MRPGGSPSRVSPTAPLSHTVAHAWSAAALLSPGDLLVLFATLTGARKFTHGDAVASLVDYRVLRREDAPGVLARFPHGERGWSELDAHDVRVARARFLELAALPSLRPLALRAPRLASSAPSEWAGAPSTARSTTPPPPRTSAPPPRSASPSVRPPPREPVSTPAVVPPAPPISRPPVSVSPLDLAGLGALLEAPASARDDVAHALTAYALAHAQQFEELLSLATLRGVDSHRYQIETVRRVVRVLRGRALLADEVGLGKTIEAIMVLREYQLRGMVKRVLVVAPSPLVAQWAGELLDKAGIEARTTEDPAFRRDAEAFFAADGVVVASLSSARTGRCAPILQSKSWDLVVVDEAHHVKNRSTLGWKLIDGLKSRFLLLLTATPIENDLEEIYNLVTLLKPGQLATPAAFRKAYVDASDPLSPRNRERLRALLAEVMVRNTRAQSGLALPPRFVSTHVVDPSDDERALYDSIVAMFRRHGGDHAARLAASTLLLEAGSSPAAVRGTLERIAGGERHREALRADAKRLLSSSRDLHGSRKGDALLEILRGESEQVLVFTRYRETLAYLGVLLREAGVAYAPFHGGLDAAAKGASLEAFRAGSARVLLATDVGGEGQNLQHCHVLVNYDLPWNPMRIEQRIGRLHRMGQQSEVRVYNLCARGTIEERVLDVLDRRLHLFELVVGEMDMVLGNLVDERDLEDRILDLYADAEDDDAIAVGFEKIADELATARGRYEKTRALDTALFGKDYEA